ncbi:hypothetical protein, partial [Streptomyces sp. MBT97]|uniref:hypothetical protein n=1 Tax=Streptomyces sp. MBT97 TaxID=2800411 RepID=UPI001F31994C
VRRRNARRWARPRTGARYVVGLGRTPLGADRFQDVAARWVTGLHGVEVTRVEGGTLPTVG